MPASSDTRLAAMELQLEATHQQPAYFHGLTMRPLLVEGDEVDVEPVTWAEVRVGDVVTYRFEDKFPTRRVMATNPSERTFVIMGDSIPAFRRYVVPFDDVLARVTRRRRGDRWLTSSDLRWHWLTVRARVRLAWHESLTVRRARHHTGRLVRRHHRFWSATRRD